MMKLLVGNSKYRLDETGLVQRRKSGGSWVDCAQYKGGRGYPSVKIAGKNYFVHRLVASMFVANPDYLEYTVVHHKDEDIANCHADNLEWTNQPEHIGLHMLDAQIEINKDNKGKYSLVNIKADTKLRLAKAKGSATFDGYVNYLLELAEEV